MNKKFYKKNLWNQFFYFHISIGKNFNVSIIFFVWLKLRLIARFWSFYLDQGIKKNLSFLILPCLAKTVFCSQQIFFTGFSSKIVLVFFNILKTDYEQEVNYSKSSWLIKIQNQQN